MTAITHAISAALLYFVWQGALVAFLLWITLAVLRKASAQLRYMVSCAGLAVMIALPLVTAWLVYRAPGTSGAIAGQMADIPRSGFATLSGAAPLPGWIAVLEAWTLPVWFAGVLVFAVRLFWSSRHVAKLQRESDPAAPSLIDMVSRLSRRLNIARPVRVVISKLADSPSVTGWIRPVVLIPSATLLNLSVEQLEAVLAHELAHIRRNDYFVNLLQTLVETLFFYQPAVWWVSSRIRHERELCCDDMAVEVCGDAVGYARALAKLERLRLISPEVISPDLAIGSTGGTLLYRIQRLTGTVEEQPPSKLAACFALCLALLCFVMNLPWARAQQQPQNARELTVSRQAIWMDSVKYGDVPIMVRAIGTVTTPAMAELNVAASQANLVQLGQRATIELRRRITINGKVARIDSSAAGATVNVAVELQTTVPEFTGEPVDGIILIKTLTNVIWVGRPAVSSSNGESTLFKMDPEGNYATRVKVRFGASSVNSVQVLEGLQPGDRVILSDTTKYHGVDRIRLVE